MAGKTRLMTGMERPEDIEFESEVDRKYICPICLTFYWEPVQTVCGHRFCTQCISGVIRERHRKHHNETFVRCPVDNKFFNVMKDMFEDKAFKREIMSLRVWCKNKSNGCSWVNELSDYQHHLPMCAYQSLECVYGCGQRLMMYEHNRHKEICERRPVHCEHCNQRIIFADLIKHQVLMCADFPVQCTLCQQSGIRRRDISTHIDVNSGDCPQTIVPCKYASYGCQYQNKRRLMADHYKSDPDSHILLLVQHNAHQDREILRLKQCLEKIIDFSESVIGKRLRDVMDDI